MAEKRLKPINIFIVNDVQYQCLLNKAIASLNQLGLFNEKDYTVFGVPPAFAEHYFPIMFKAYLDKIDKTRLETFFGKMD